MWGIGPERPQWRGVTALHKLLNTCQFISGIPAVSAPQTRVMEDDDVMR